MELLEVTPSLVAAILAYLISLGYLGAFISPIVAGALVETMGLYTSLLVNILVQIVAIICMFLVRETRLRTRKK